MCTIVCRCRVVRRSQACQATVDRENGGDLLLFVELKVDLIFQQLVSFSPSSSIESVAGLATISDDR